jgi:hypothetical protein
VCHVCFCFVLVCRSYTGCGPSFKSPKSRLLLSQLMMRR